MKTKQKLLSWVLVCWAGCSWVGQAQTNIQNDPAYLPIDQVLDLQVIKPEVNINLPRFLLLEAASEFDGSPKDPLAQTGINFKDLVKDIKLIRLVVIEAREETRPHIEKAVAELRKKVAATWTPIIIVQEENVGIYALGDESGDGMAGLALIIYDKGNTVIANIVGKVSIGKVLRIATQMNAIPKDILEKLSGTSGRTDDRSKESSPKEDSKEGNPEP
jgi:hypothetical protein